MKIKYDICDLESFLNESEITNYHQTWYGWNSNHQKDKEKKEIVQSYTNDQVLIGKIFLMTKEELPSLATAKGEIIVGRSKVFQETLKNIIPHNYQFGKIKKYLYPFWNEYHMWEVIEQMGHGTRNLFAKEKHKEILEFIITPKSFFNIKKQIFFYEDVDVEFVWNFKGMREIKGIKTGFEDGCFSFYNNNDDLLGRIGTVGFTKQREWCVLVQKIKEGYVKARESLCQKILIHRKYLDKIGRTPPYKTKDILESINNGIIEEEKLQKFFSLWDLG